MPQMVVILATLGQPGEMTVHLAGIFGWQKQGLRVVCKVCQEVLDWCDQQQMASLLHASISSTACEQWG